uniref:Putative conserved secreted protein ovary overexpressed n=2 Tax=Rhipicephalus microplus TaxID=6941 RepID=A0A6M2D052_RHIMP
MALSIRAAYMFCATFMVIALVLCAHWAQSACPRRRGQYSDCAYTTCTPESCATRGLECCPEPCGGTWCVKGVELRRSRRAPSPCPTFVPPPDGCEGLRNNVSCLELNCKSKAFICCHGPCGNPFCLKV